VFHDIAFRRQLKETQACRAANAECKEAHKKSLAAHLKVSLANHLVPTASTSATLITLKPILINFKKIQGENHVKVFQLKIQATIKRLTPFVELFNQFSNRMDTSKFYQLKRFLDRLLNLQDHLSKRTRTISPDQWQHLDFNLCQFGKIPFTSLHCHYSDVLKKVVLVLDNTALDWL
jgi:hypothetical protein